MQTLNLNQTQVQFPSTWNELSSAQVLHICTLYNTVGDVPTLKVQLFLCLVGATITGKDKQSRPGIYQLDIKGTKYAIKTEDIAYIADKSTSFILKKQHKIGSKQAIYSINSALINNPIPDYCGLIGPSNGLGNITWAEFCAAQTAYSGYCHTKHPQHLHKLIAILWREAVPGLTPFSANYNGDLRKPYNDFIADAHAVEIGKNWRANHITAALLFYEGCLNYIVARYADLFASSKNAAKSNGSVFDNMLKLTLAAADNQETKMKEVFDDPAHQVLFSINEAIKASKKMEEQLNKKKHAA